MNLRSKAKPAGFQKIAGIFLGFLAATIPCTRACATYYDQVAVPSDEIFEAARQVLDASYGIQKADSHKKSLQSQWYEDRVVRSRGLLKKFTQKAYHRRYRIHIQLKDTPEGTDVKVKGAFQEKSNDAPPGVPWRPVKTEGIDLQIEREIFSKILTQMEEIRMKARSSLQSDSGGAS